MAATVKSFNPPVISAGLSEAGQIQVIHLYNRFRTQMVQLEDIHNPRRSTNTKVVANTTAQMVILINLMLQQNEFAQHEPRLREIQNSIQRMSPIYNQDEAELLNFTQRIRRALKKMFGNVNPMQVVLPEEFLYTARLHSKDIIAQALAICFGMENGGLKNHFFEKIIRAYLALNLFDEANEVIPLIDDNKIRTRMQQHVDAEFLKKNHAYRKIMKACDQHVECIKKTFTNLQDLREHRYRAKVICTLIDAFLRLDEPSEGALLIDLLVCGETDRLNMVMKVDQALLNKADSYAHDPVKRFETLWLMSDEEDRSAAFKRIPPDQIEFIYKKLCIFEPLDKPDAGYLPFRGDNIEQAVELILLMPISDSEKDELLAVWYKGNVKERWVESNFILGAISNQRFRAKLVNRHEPVTQTEENDIEVDAALENTPTQISSNNPIDILVHLYSTQTFEAAAKYLNELSEQEDKESFYGICKAVILKVPQDHVQKIFKHANQTAKSVLHLTQAEQSREIAKKALKEKHYMLAFKCARSMGALPTEQRDIILQIPIDFRNKLLEGCFDLDETIKQSRMLDVWLIVRHTRKEQLAHHRDQCLFSCALFYAKQHSPTEFVRKIIANIEDEGLRKEADAAIADIIKQ